LLVLFFVDLLSSSSGEGKETGSAFWFDSFVAGWQLNLLLGEEKCFLRFLYLVSSVRAAGGCGDVVMSRAWRISSQTPYQRIGVWKDVVHKRRSLVLAVFGTCIDGYEVSWLC